VRYVVGGVFAFALAMVQASSVEQFRILGVAPNLMLVMLVSWLVVRGLDDVLPMIAVSGMTLGFVGLQTPGVILFALLAPLALFGIVRELKIIHSETVLVVALVLGASLLYETIVLGAVMATGGVFDPQRGMTEVVLPAAIVNLAIALPVYLVIRLARPSMPRRRNVYSF
jgi:hypothetical protein